MSLSLKARRADAQRVFKALFDALGNEHRCGEVAHGMHDEPLATALPTTIATLEEKGLIEVDSIGPSYVLTTHGWWYYVHKYAPPELLEEFRRRRFELVKAMKAAVGGRNADAFLMVDELAAAAGLPDGWVYNALMSNWFQLEDQEGRFPFTNDRGMIRIPVHFGQSADDVI
jgi:hypothetical protein